MASRLVIVLLFLQVFLPASGDKVSHQAIPSERWGYIKVREHAFMFWWLYGAQTSNPIARQGKPLVLWLQGGPGSSSTGFGNFEEIGPLDVDLKPRNTTWIKEANVLFVDNPVGCGFSYVDEPGAYTKNISDITADLLIFMTSFLEELPVFKKVPLFIAGESYGGKMIAAFGSALYDLIKEGTIQCEFAGVALGDSLISFQDTIPSYGPYLFSLSLLDGKDLNRVQQLSEQCAEAAYKGDYNMTMDLSDQLNKLISNVTDNVDVYNVLRHIYVPYSITYQNIFKNSPSVTGGNLFVQYLARSYSDPLFELMNGPIRKKLGIIPSNVTWGGQAAEVSQHQRNDVPSPVIEDVSHLINAGVKVVVYQGQLDMVCGTLGAESWIKKLSWVGLQGFLSTSRKPLYAPSKLAQRETGAFLKAYKNFELYYILNAGHMVPADAPEMALEMLKNILT